jgi:maltose alpha-D-glucosyltransferase/alpha-amylase
MVAKERWFKNATIYSLPIGEFGGDLGGVERRLDHLVSLGITCVWLLPMLESPRRDFGYDATNHFTVDPRYGTLGDLASLIRAAHARSLRVVVDLPLQHTSRDHPWFQEARQGPTSPRHGYYIWRDEEPDPDEGPESVVWTAGEKRAWTYDERAGRWYRHLFYAHEPDLNMENDALRNELLQVLAFWLRMGVDGVRIDAGGRQTRAAAPAFGGDEQGFLRELRITAMVENPDTMLMVEADQSPEQLGGYFDPREPGGVLMFNFIMSAHLFLGLARGSAGPVAKALRTLPHASRGAQWANFLRNHDELDLERLDEDERREVVERFAPRPDMQIFDRGIRRRLGPMLDFDPAHLRLAYSALLALPGAPVVLWGDEIPLDEDLRRPDRDAARPSMPWPRARTARADPGSLLNWLAGALRVRRELPHLGWGHTSVLDTDRHEVLALRHDWSGETVVVLCNFGREPQDVRLAGCDDVGQPIELLSSGEHPIPADLTGPLPVGGLGYRWFRAAITTPHSGGTVPENVRRGSRSSLASTTSDRSGTTSSIGRSEKLTATSRRSSPASRT